MNDATPWYEKIQKDVFPHAMRDESELADVADAPRIRIPDAERDALEKFIQPFVDAGSLIPILCDANSKLDMDSQDEGMELLRQSQALIAKGIQEHAPTLFAALAAMAEEKPPHVFVATNLPVGELPKRPSSWFLNATRAGTLSDYLQAGAGLILGGAVGLQSLRYFDVIHNEDDPVGKQLSGVPFHNDNPEDFFLLEGHVGNPSAYTLFHHAEALHKTLTQKNFEILEKMGYMKNNNGRWEFNVQSAQEIARAMMLAKLWKETLTEEEKEACGKFIVAMDDKSAMCKVALGKGEMAVANARQCAHSTTPCKVSEQRRWLERAAINRRTVPGHNICLRANEIDQEALLKRITAYTSEQRSHTARARNTQIC